MAGHRRQLRRLGFSVAIAAGAFAVAWMAGRAGADLSVLHALAVAVYSYVFWAYSFPGLLVTELALYLGGSSIDYVSPPIGALALQPGSIPDAVMIVSIVHCLSTGAIAALVWDSLPRVAGPKVRRGLVAGASVGALIGIAAVLPHEVRPASATLDVALTYATAPVDMLFGWLDATVPVAEHRLEMSVRRVPKLVGAYVLLLAVFYALVAGGTGWMMVRRSDGAERDG